MRKIRCWLIILGLLILAPLVKLRADDYLLGPGDVLNISVWGYDQLQLAEVNIRPDGKIAVPLIGELNASGLTPLQLSDQIKDSLTTYLKNPVVTINIVKFRTIRVYVLGEVTKPGMYELEKQHNLLDAVSIAGGYTIYALKSKVYVVSKESGQYQKVNLAKILKKGDLTQNVLLHDGDVVYLAGNGVNFINDILPYIAAAYQIKILTSP